MDIFKMKVIVDNAQIELEGDSSTVYKIFQELKEQGLGELSSLTKKNVNNSYMDTTQATNISQNDSVKEKKNSEEENTEESFELPTLQTAVLQEKPNSEVEWLLVYAIYCSQEGTIFFTKEDLRSKYGETNRQTPTRSKNFSSNIKTLVSKGYISMVNATDIRLEKSGLEEAKKIIFRKEMKKNTSPSKKKKKTTMYKLIDLNLSETERSDFRAFWNQHKHSAYMDKAVLSAYWLSKHKEINDFTADHFFTLLRTINENASFDIAGALKNSKQLKNHFIYDIDSNSYKLHHIGEDYVKSLENKELGSNE